MNTTLPSALSKKKFERPRMTRKMRRLWLTLSCFVCFGTAAALILNVLSSNIVFFMTPSQILQKTPAADRPVRLGGMVVAGSLRRSVNGHVPLNFFTVTDGQTAISVRYVGVLPDLFRDGQSVVALGIYQSGAPFEASEVLAKHDETYMPKEVAQALQQSGKWDRRFGRPPSTGTLETMTAVTTQKTAGWR